MKKIIFAAALVLAGPAFAGDKIEGLWQTEPDDGHFSHIAVGPCGSMLCGVIAKTFLEDGTPTESENIGKNLLFDLVNNGDGTYTGKAWRPSNDKVYIGKVKWKGNDIKMSGCVLGGLLCIGQIWKRVN